MNVRYVFIIILYCGRLVSFFQRPAATDAAGTRTRTHQSGILSRSVVQIFLHYTLCCAGARLGTRIRFCVLILIISPVTTCADRAYKFPASRTFIIYVWARSCVRYVYILYSVCTYVHAHNSARTYRTNRCITVTRDVFCSTEYGSVRLIARVETYLKDVVLYYYYYYYWFGRGFVVRTRHTRRDHGGKLISVRFRLVCLSSRAHGAALF